MTEFTILALMKETIYLTFLICAPLLAIGTFVGIVVSIFQTATSIQDQSLAFIPKLVATALSIVVFGPWMLSLMLQFSMKILGGLQNFAR